LAREALEMALVAAIAEWTAAGHQIDLSGLSVEIADLDGPLLGATSDGLIVIDVDAAGWGWTAFGGQMDLLSVVRHELGHVLGFEHADEGPMAATLAAGTVTSPGGEIARHTEVTMAAIDVLLVQRSIVDVPVVEVIASAPLRIGEVAISSLGSDASTAATASNLMEPLRVLLGGADDLGAAVASTTGGADTSWIMIWQMVVTLLSLWFVGALLGRRRRATARMR
jgi:hypothetical protein